MVIDLWKIQVPGVSLFENTESTSAGCTELPGLRQKEMSTTPLSELGVEGRVVVVTDFLVAAVEVLHVLIIDVRGGDVCASPVPPLWRDALPLRCFKVPAMDPGVSCHLLFILEVLALQRWSSACSAGGQARPRTQGTGRCKK